MRTAGLPTFTKLWGRNDNQKLPKGRYQIAVNLSKCSTFCAEQVAYLTHLVDYPVRPYKGTKSIVISTVSWIGGKNPFLGWAYVAAAGVLVLLGILGTIRHLVKPRFVLFFSHYIVPWLTLACKCRKLGDMTLLSFNR